MSHPLLREDETYTRYLDVVQGYIDDQSKLLSIRTGRCIDYCKKFVEKTVDEHAIKDVVMKVLRRDKNGDRVKDTVGFLQYLKWIDNNGHILAPNMITYAHPDKRQSYTSLFIRDNLAERSRIKKAGQRAKQLGQSAKMNGNLEEAERLMAEAYFANLEQGNKKFFNNSMSGASASEHNPLYYLTKHTSLTSTCRTCTSIANSISEKLLASNRHYYDFDVTLEAISYTLNNSNQELIAEVVEKYGIVAPTVEQVKTIVFESCKNYWSGAKKYKVIEEIIEGMSELDRITFAYVGDLNAMTMYSGKFIRHFYDRIVKRENHGTYTKDVLKIAHEDLVILAAMTCEDFMKGLSPYDLESKDPEKFQIFCNALGTVMATVSEHADFLNAFFITDVQPQNIFSVKDMVRKAVPASDTDSCIYTAQRQVKWYSGKVDWSPMSVAAASTTAFLVSSMVTHSMFKLSRQIGVAEDEKYRIAMKGEYFMPVLMVSNLTKHYAYLVSACEGKIYDKPSMDCKGVQLKSSKLPSDITAKSFEWYKKVMIAITENRDITPTTIMAYPAYLEHLVKKHIKSGSIDFFSKESIKTPSNYKNPASSPYVYADLWNKTFGRKYGEVSEFPATAKKIPLLINKKDKVNDWLETLEPALRDSISEWMHDNNKDKFGHVLVPQMNLPGGKLNKELIGIINIRKLLSELTDHAYIFMSMLGILVKNGGYTRLCSDFIDEETCVRELAKLDLELFKNW